jgi:hypothetical protein
MPYVPKGITGYDDDTSVAEALSRVSEGKFLEFIS